MCLRTMRNRCSMPLIDIANSPGWLINTPSLSSREPAPKKRKLTG
jgi:hypothetical protein